MTTHERIQELRAQGMGLTEARDQAVKERLIRLVDEATSLNDIKTILRAILQKI